MQYKPELWLPAGRANPGGRVILVLQVVTDFPEWRQLLPAGDEGAGA